MIGTTLAHYEILEKLGEGGMGVVYKARDPRLNRFVALKVLPAALARDESRRARLLREARAASALSHPHIVVVHDIAQENDHHFIVMEYLEGRSLSDLIPLEGLPLDEALPYATDIADALAAAHRVGVVHRDLKPGNVVISAGGVKVLDFGLAKQLVEDPSDEDAPTRSRALTGPGLVMGTLSYMSPEQASGDAVDARSDIFSFGTLLYEMLTGRLPFQGKHSAVVLHEILYTTPLPPSHLAPAVPATLDALVAAVLQKRPRDRPESMERVTEALSSIRAHQVTAPLRPATPTAVPALRRRARHASGPPRRGTERSSLAVLPFVSLTSDPEDAHMAAGIASEIIGALCGVPDLKVASRVASFQFDQAAPDLKKVARTLDIRYVLTGSLRRSGNRIRVIVELTDAVPGTQLWSKTFEREVIDLFALPEEMARAIVGATGGQIIRADTERASRSHPGSLDAWGLLHRAYGVWNRGFSREGVDEALQLLRRAIAVDPGYAAAHAALGTYLIQRVVNACTDQPEAEKAEALAAAERAVELAPNDPTVLEYAGLVWHDTGRHEKAVAAERRCVHLAPFNLVAWGYLAFALGWAGDPSGVEEAQRILDGLIDTTPDHPSLPYWLWFKSGACARQDLFAESAEAARYSLELNPGYILARAPYANALGLLGRLDEAREAWGLAQAANPAFTPAFYRGLAREVMVREDRAEKHIGGLRAAGLLPPED
jgi:serine/threonine protein kinase/tetratricopeptide (TPR) repeat protein